MYFPGSVQEQIAEIQQRVAKLEGVEPLANQSQAPFAGGSYTFRSATGGLSGQSSGTYRHMSLQDEQDRRIGEQARVAKEMLISGRSEEHTNVQKTAAGSAPGSPKQPTFVVAYNISRGNEIIYADSFRFEAGFVIFETGPSLTNGLYSGVAALPIDDIRSIKTLLEN